MVLSRVSQAMYGAVASVYGAHPATPATLALAGEAQPHKKFLELLWAVYWQNGLYDPQGYALYTQGIHREAIKGLRTAGNRAVEFYTATIWPGVLPDALPIETENEAIIPAIHQVWQWSDWSRQRQVYVRWASIFGSCFVKVALRPDKSRVFFQLIDPRHVVDFDTDERGILTWIRIDVPQDRRNDATGRTELVTHTEVWERDANSLFDLDAPGGLRAMGRFRRWVHKKGDERNLEQLGTPEEDRPLSDFGVDFIPIDHVMAKDSGMKWGMGVFAHAIEKLTELDRQATHLAQSIFRGLDEQMALEAPDAIAADGRPGNLPPPRVQGMNSTSTDDGTVAVGAMRLYRIPAGWTLKTLIPDINYEAGLHILQDMGAELTRDLPELAYYDMVNWPGDPSGRSVRLRLAAAIDRAKEARGNLEAALVRLNMMALTMGQNAGIPLFQGIGTYEAGSFAHAFKERDVLPADELEDAQTLLARSEALVKRQEWLAAATPTVLREEGFSDEEIRTIERERAARQAAAGAQQQALAPPAPEDAPAAEERE